MAVLFDLSTELLFEIISCLYAQWDDEPSGLWSLSETCKRLNGFCGHWIFARYHLCLRSPNYSYFTPIDTVGSLESWNLEAVTARLLHFRGKALYVQELILEDFRNDEVDEDEPGLFPDCILHDLVDALKEAIKVTTIEVTCGRGGILPLLLWEWITTKKLTDFIIGPHLAPPPDAKIHPNIHTFKGGLYEGPIQFLDLVCPEKILLNYQCLEDEQPKIYPYKPSGPHSSRLRKIVLEVTLPSEFDTPLFDFSSVPNATIKAQFNLNVTFDMYIPAAWKRLKHKLLIVFTEGLDEYDVARSSRGGATVRRPTLAEIESGWKPKNAVHLKGEDAERAEEEEMEFLYALDRWEQLGRRRVLILDV
ncbi:hypothetical protein PILCRDRAFT_823487 [Piloderma croceum F 1598]|uniref:F-box domain-containing protein n=1 Tax=Piloderma croceum (strain F 1598) TaxID=765440 RepID=A0A0C3F3B0_PILCF|nr:hypothetical protein PILCRDRAFT_823487 [Piloderma croceum F 1598]